MNHRKILLVDDEKIIRETGSIMLRSLGFDCITAEDGKDCLNKFRSGRDQFDLIILDVEMPGLKGNEVFELLKKEKDDVVVLFTSGYARNYIEERVFKKRIENFIAKPLNIKELGIKIEEVLGQRNV